MAKQLIDLAEDLIEDLNSTIIGPRGRYFGLHLGSLDSRYRKLVRVATENQDGITINYLQQI